MNDHEKKGKVGGSVLFTVIVVMMVLVVFLMGTLGLASAANKRAQNSYTSSQAQYTARMAVESVLAAMQNDYVVAKTVNDLATGKMGENSIPVEIDTSQLYPKDAGSIAAYGTVTSCTIERAGQDYYYVDNKWIGRDMIKITATAQLGSQENTVSAYIMKKDTTIKPINNPGGGGGGLVAAGAAKFGTKVSVFGGAGINLGNRWRNVDPADALRGYSYDEHANYASSDSAGGTAWEAPFVVNGSYSAPGAGASLVFPELGSGFTFWGNFYFNNQIAITSGNLAVLNAGSSAALNYTDIPYIYVEKTLSITNGAKGVNVTNKIPLNILCGNTSIITTDPIYANLYMMNDNTPDSEKVEKQVYWPEFKIEKYANYINFNGGSLLSNWTYRLINGRDDPTEHVGGSIYAQDELCIDADNQKGVVEGNLVVDDDLLISTQEFVVEGDLVVKGKLKITNGRVKVGGKFYHDNQAGDDYTDKVFKADGSTKLEPSAYDSSKGYPSYMTREYVLGLKDATYTGKDASGKNVELSRKFVNTLQDTMQTAMDPYKNACYGLPEAYHKVVAAWDSANSSNKTDELKKLGTVMNTDYGNYLIRSYSKSDEESGDIVITDTDVAVLKKGTYDKPIHVVPNEDHKTIWLIVEDGVGFSASNSYGIIFEDCQLETEKIADTYNEDGNPRYKMKSTGDTETYKNFATKTTADENGVYQGKYDLRILVLGEATFNGGGIWSRQYVSLSEGNVPFQIYTSGDCAVYKGKDKVYTPARPNIYVYANTIDPDKLKDSDALDEIEKETHYRPTTTNACKYLNVNNSNTYKLSHSSNVEKAVLTGFVVAPYMDVEWDAAQNSFSGDVYYNGLNVNDTNICKGTSKTITFIGSVVAHDIDMKASGSITMYYPAYIPDAKDPPEVKEPNYMKNWALVQFENY